MAADKVGNKKMGGSGTPELSLDTFTSAKVILVFINKYKYEHKYRYKYI